MTADTKIRTGLKSDPKGNSEMEAKSVHRDIVTTDPNFQRKIVWKNVIGFIYLHVAALYGLYLSLVSTKLLTNLWAILLLFASSQGVLMGAHRLYSHRSFKASWQLRLILVVLQTVAGQNCMYIWVRDHRQHHKYSDTDADPHNAIRGFFFSHIGWLMSKKHPKVIEKGKGIDMGDLEADSIVMFQKRYYKTLYTILAIAVPTLVPYYLWQENIWNSFFVAYFLRYVLQLHGTWTVNSVTHIFGNRPYDKDLVPVENTFIAKLTMGEGWHNYHHAFPYDYQAAEFGYRDASLTTQIIDLMAKIGWATDLKTASYDMVKRRTLRKGDGTHNLITDYSSLNVNGVINNASITGKLMTDALEDLDDKQKNEKLQKGNSVVEADYLRISEEDLKGKPKMKAIDTINLKNSKVFNQG